MIWATDKVLNHIILMLLKTSQEDRVASEGWWASTMDWACHEWANRHPGTMAPAYVHATAPSDCFAGVLPPIYEWPLDKTETVH